MKALLCRAFGDYRELSLTDVREPALGPGMVVVAPELSTIGHGHIVIIAGKYQRRPPLPFVPGTDLTGVVVAVHPTVAHRAVGDRVVAAVETGAFAEQVLVRADRTWRVPEGVDFERVSGIPGAYATCKVALMWRARLASEETLVVLGAAGGLGVAAVQLGKLAGAKVIAVARSEDRLASARAAGADICVQSGPLDLARRIKEANGGRGADVIFDPVGGDVSREVLHCVRPGGRILILGFAGGIPPEIPANQLLVKNIDLIGVNLSHYMWGWRDEPAETSPRLHGLISGLLTEVADGKLSPMKPSTYALSEFRQAFADVAERRSIGRMVLRIKD